jgi:hypothetical protein
VHKMGWKHTDEGADRVISVVLLVLLRSSVGNRQ